LVVDAQHRLTKTGKNFGILSIEDYTGKTEFTLWSEEYVKYVNYLEVGRIVLLEGAFKQRFNTSPYEFKITKLHLLETVKTSMTKQLTIDIEPQDIDQSFVQFLEANLHANPGSTNLKINIQDIPNQKKISLNTIDKGITLNDDLIQYLMEHKSLYVSVTINT